MTSLVRNVLASVKQRAQRGTGNGLHRHIAGPRRHFDWGLQTQLSCDFRTVLYVLFLFLSLFMSFLYWLGVGAIAPSGVAETLASTLDRPPGQAVARSSPSTTAELRRKSVFRISSNGLEFGWNVAQWWKPCSTSDANKQGCCLTAKDVNLPRSSAQRLGPFGLIPTRTDFSESIHQSQCGAPPA